MKSYVLFILSLVVISCSSMQQSEEERIRRLNCKTDRIYRYHDEKLFDIEEVRADFREKYPWENHSFSKEFRLTKEFFRCKGSSSHPKIQLIGQEGILDCGGIEKHGLPFHNQEEFIYPILIDLLNYIQERAEKKVVITSGHRCPIHNIYVNPKKPDTTSKHQLGAEVDFYVESYETEPREIIRWIIEYYQEREPNNPFLKCQKNPEGIRHPGWYNKEVAIRVHEKDEGRDFDNRHPYPYITIEVRQDRKTGERVAYTPEKAGSGYLRY